MHSNAAVSFERLEARLALDALPLYWTGMNGDVSRITGNGVIDPHYTVHSSAADNWTSAKTVTSTSPWTANSNFSDWITRSDADAAGNAPAGYYDYLTLLDLTDYVPSSVSISGSWATDDFGTAIYVNGQNTGNPQAHWNSWINFAINSGFVSGENYLDFQVYNTSGNTGVNIAINGTADRRQLGVQSAASDITATEGATTSGTFASFTDNDSADSASDLSAIIAWGDGSYSSGTVSGGSGTFAVSGSHVYADAVASRGEMSVTLTRDGAADATAHPIVNVVDAPLSGISAAISPTEGAAFSGPVAYFNDPNPNSALSDLAATIYWGDRLTTTGTIAPSPGTTGKSYVISGTHLYATDAIAPLGIRVTDKGGSTITISNPAKIVGGADLSIKQQADQGTGVVGMPITFTVSLTNNSAATTITNLAISDAWSNAQLGSYSSSIGTVTSTGNGATFEVPQLAPGATATITLGLTPQSAGAVTNSLAVTADQPTLSWRNYKSTINTWAADASSASPQSPVQNYVAAVYRDTLGREPDASGLSYWTDQLNLGASKDGVAQQLTHSAEYFHTIILPRDRNAR